MFNVICSLPNASDLISGVPFEPTEDGSAVITVDPVDEETATMFRDIPGYSVIDLDAPAGTAAAAEAITSSRGRGRPSKVELAARAAAAAPPVVPAPPEVVPEVVPEAIPEAAPALNLEPEQPAAVEIETEQGSGEQAAAPDALVEGDTPPVE